jgi:phosphatidylserine/phosphatidylglycerophosphate/cardiolipin synthase-like enzyme
MSNTGSTPNQTAASAAWMRSVSRIFASAKSSRRTTVRRLLGSIGLGVAIAFSSCAFADIDPPAYGCGWQGGFSPSRGGMDLVIGLIDSAQAGQTVEVAAYEFTSRRMARALHAALRRDVAVRIAVDARENVGKPYSVAYQFIDVPGAEIRYEDHWPIFHEKVTLVRALNAVEEGSMNYTDAGDTKNRENANLLTSCPAAVKKYGADFDDFWAQGTPLH